MRFPSLAKSPTNRLGLAYFALTVGLTSLVFVLVQQDLRQGANDPQIQLAHDGHVEALTGETIDVSASLAPFLIVYDDQLKVVGTTGQLDGKTPIPPSGVFSYAKSHADNRFTWEPKNGVRLATVLVHHEGGYVLAARNLHEVELRESQAQAYASAMLLALLIIGVIVIVIIK